MADMNLREKISNAIAEACDELPSYRFELAADKILGISEIRDALMVKAAAERINAINGAPLIIRGDDD